MKRASAGLAVLIAGMWLGCGLPVAAQESVAERLEKSPRHHEWVDVETPAGRKVRTWVVYPEVDKPATAVIVIHENKGLTDWVRGVADQLAGAGYLALAPDMLSGTGPESGATDSFGSEDAARDGIYKLPADQVMADLDAVAKYAEGLSAGNKVVAVGGFCWGGGKTFEYACHNPNIAAAFVFYGSAPSDEAAYAKINAPVYGFYGGNDFRITGSVPDVEARMKKLDKQYFPIIYKDAGHGFMRQGETISDENSPDHRAHDLAWGRWKEELSQLGKK